MYLNLLWNLFVGWNPRLGYPPLMKDERELVLGWENISLKKKGLVAGVSRYSTS